MQLITFKFGNKMAVSLTKKKELIYSDKKILTRKLIKGKIAKNYLEKTKSIESEEADIYKIVSCP